MFPISQYDCWQSILSSLYFPFFQIQINILIFYQIEGNWKCLIISWLISSPSKPWQIIHFLKTLLAEIIKARVFIMYYWTNDKAIGHKSYQDICILNFYINTSSSTFQKCVFSRRMHSLGIYFLRSGV